MSYDNFRHRSAPSQAVLKLHTNRELTTLFRLFLLRRKDSLAVDLFSLLGMKM